MVKAFNSTGQDNMADPTYADGRPVMFLCGDEAAACALAAQVIEAVGFEPVEVGPLSKARLLEPLALLWITTAMRLGRRDVALRLMRR